MSIKKKLLIALLSATCLTAGAFGLAACDKDDGLKNAYQTYKEAAGENALDYDAWLLMIQTQTGEEIKVTGAEWNESGDIVLTYTDGSTQTIDMNNQTIKSHTFNDNGDLVITFKDGTTTVIKLPKTYTVRATDNNGEPVADVWLSVGYLNKNWSFVHIAHAKTNADGVATFSFVPDDSVKYRVQIADTESLKISGPAIPSGYTVDFGVSDITKLPNNYVEIDEDRSARILFNVRPGAFIASEVKELVYSSKYNATTPDTPDVTYKPLEVELKANTYGYFYFSPYVNLGGGTTQDKTQELIDNATKAARGKYKISFTVTGGGASVEMYNFNGSRAYLNTDGYGIPLEDTIVYKTGDGTPYTDATSITLNLHSDVVKNENVFGLKATADCTVKITVEKTGDSVEPPKVETQVVEVTGTPAKWNNAEKLAGGQLTLMPLTGALNIVKDDDGFYRVGSKSGPYLLVNLTRQISRVADSAIINLPQSNDRGEAVFIKSVYGGEYNFLLEKYDYNDLVKTYANLVNSDGVYGVNDDLKDFLEFFGQLTYGAADLKNEDGTIDSTYSWLVPCQYYVPSSGLPASGSGTQADPFVILDIKNGVDASQISGNAYMQFTASATGLYGFELSEGTLSVADRETIVRDGVTYVALNAGESVVCTAEGGKAYSVTVKSDDVLLAVYDVQSSDGVTVDNSKGTSEKKALRVSGAGAKAYLVDKSVCEEGLYISFSVLGNGTYKLDLGDSSSARIKYNGQVYSGGELEIEAVTGTEYSILLTTELDAGNIIDGLYLLNIIKL